MPQPLRTMKLIASGVTFSAAIDQVALVLAVLVVHQHDHAPCRSSSRASSMVQNPSCTVDMRVLVGERGCVRARENVPGALTQPRSPSLYTIPSVGM